MVGRGQDIARRHDGGERLAPCMPCRRFRTFAPGGIHPYMAHLQRDIQRRTGRGTVRHPGVGFRLQAMVHVDGAQSAALQIRILRQAMQQDGRIASAAQRHPHASFRGGGQ